MERVAFKSNNFEQADKWDVKQHINLTVEERLSIARALKDRIHPTKLKTSESAINPDWPHRKKVELEAEPSPIPINYLDLENLIKNKEASARPKDLDDLKYLKSSKKSD